MQIDTEHLHHWMQAIRKSPDPLRTMDAFWSGQLKSKEWLIDNLSRNVYFESTVDIFGGWVGVLASMLFQSKIPISSIRSFDIDIACEEIAKEMNKLEEMAGKFSAITLDMCGVKTDADIVINTSCEHLTQEQYNQWLSNVSKASLIVLQSNNYAIPEHIRIASTLEEFKQQSNLDIVWAGELELPLYKRFMIIGRR